MFTLAVRGVDSQDATGPVATVKCSTALRDMLTLECNANALLVSEFSDPYADTGITPTDYTVRITKAGDTQTTSRRVRDTFVFTGAEYGAQYTVTVTASHGTGWAQYTESDTITCPTHTNNWNSPNFYDRDEDCNNNTPFVGWLTNYFCRQGENQLVLSGSYLELLGLKPALIEIEPVLLSRSCSINEAQTQRTCTETWSENIILLKNPGIDWRALRITDWSGPDEIIQNGLTIAAFVLLVPAVAAGGWVLALSASVVGGTTYFEVVAYKKDASAKEYIRVYPSKEAAVADAAGTNLDVQSITNFEGCLAEYDLSPQTETLTDSHTYGTFTDVRISTYHYCLPD